MGSGKRRREGRHPAASIRHLLSLYMMVFWAAGVHHEREPALIDLVADEYIISYLGRGQGSVQHFCCVCVCVCVCVCKGRGSDWCMREWSLSVITQIYGQVAEIYSVGEL